MTIDRSMFVLRKGPVGCAVAWSGWRRARGGVEKLVEIELVDEKPCAAGRLSCGPISAAACCTYASSIIQQFFRHVTMVINTAID